MIFYQFKFSLIIFPLLMFFGILLAKKIGFVDKPNHRKIHTSKIVNISGVIIYIYLFFLSINTELSYEVEKIIYVGLILILIGIIDDKIEINPVTKLILIIFPSGYLIFNGFELTDIGNYEYFGLIQLKKASIIFTFLSIILLINAINYIDGTDGLLIGYTITNFLYFNFLTNGDHEFAKIFNIFIYILVVSLFFNFLPIKYGVKSFLGNSGSLFIGFFISFVIIFLYKYQNIHPSFLIWACWLPVYDLLYVTYVRLINKENFYKPDNSHLHHEILKYFSKNHIKTFLFLNMINLIIIIIGYLVSLFIGKIHSVFLFIFLFIIFSFIRSKFTKYNQDKNF